MRSREMVNKANEHLSEIRNLNGAINDKLTEIEELRERMLSTPSMDYSKDRVQSSPAGGAGFEDMVARIDSINSEVDELIDELDRTKSNLARQITILPERYRRFIEMYYIELRSPEETAETLNYTEKDVRDLQNYALLSYYTIYMQK